jgi:hypothetical protein
VAGWFMKVSKDRMKTEGRGIIISEKEDKN